MKTPAILDDLDIDATGFLSHDPKELIAFHKRVQAKAAELAALLDQQQSRSVASREDAFRQHAQSSSDAADEAKSAMEAILDVIDNVSNEALVHLAPLVNELGKNFKDRIRTASFENWAQVEVIEEVNKKVVHAQYVQLRDIHKKWMALVKVMNFIPEDKYPALLPIPAKGGNYDNTNNSDKVRVYTNYIYTIVDDDGTVNKYLSVYSFARRIGIEVSNRMDLHEAISEKHNAGEWENINFAVWNEGDEW